MYVIGIFRLIWLILSGFALGASCASLLWIVLSDLPEKRGRKRRKHDDGTRR